jgi:hypothetical protein
MGRAISWVVITCSVLVQGCGLFDDVGTGACDGFQNGQYIYISLGNFSTTTYDVTLNERPLGTLQPFSTVNNQPGFLDLGLLPNCDGHVVDVKGTVGSAFGDRFCALPSLLNCANPDPCEVQLGVCTQFANNGDCLRPDGAQFPLERDALNTQMPNTGQPLCTCSLSEAFVRC